MLLRIIGSRGKLRCISLMIHKHNYKDVCDPYKGYVNWIYYIVKNTIELHMEMEMYRPTHTVEPTCTF
jgi:hypothetical protein